MYIQKEEIPITYLFAALIIGIMAFELPELIKAHSFKEIVIFSCFLLIAFYLGMVQLFGWPFYSIMSELAYKMQAIR